jgi:predicted amidohydrolase YtcJ
LTHSRPKALFTSLKPKLDLILYGGRIYPHPFARAPVDTLAVSGGKVIYLGTHKEASKLAGRAAERINLRGKTVIPAFTDCHVHFLSWALSLRNVNLDGMADFGKVLAKIKSAGEKLSQDEWLIGRGWNKNLWREVDFPNKSHLDEIVPHNPVLLRSKDGHTVWANSPALKLAKIDRNTPDPDGGVIGRDERGDPTGILHENACLLFEGCVKGPERGILKRALLSAVKQAHRQGVVGVHDCEENQQALSLWQELLLEGKLNLRVYKMIPEEQLVLASSLGLSTGFGGEHLRIGPVKSFADGALGSQTAYMFDPHEGNPDNFGVEVQTREKLHQLIEKALGANLSLAVHAIGDRANYNVISAYGKYKRQFTKRGLRPRIEHAQLLRGEDIPKFAASNIIASVQPSHLVSDRDTAERHWGARCRTAYPFKSLVKSGALLCFGSDVPIERLNPLEGIYAAVNRQRPGDPRGAWYPEERLTVAEAVAGFTTWAAQASGESHIKGSLEPGKLADMVVLSDDILQVRAEQLHEIKVLATFLAGRPVYRDKSYL